MSAVTTVLIDGVSRARSKSDRTMAAVITLLAEHASDTDGLPTTIRFLFYELEQRGLAQKPKPDDARRNRRRSVGWPPGSQDVSDAVTRLREGGTIPWEWIADTERSLADWNWAASVADYVRERVDEARINPWAPDQPPLILTESRGMAEALTSVAAEYCCPIAGTKGQSAGFLRTVIAKNIGAGRSVLYLGDLDRSGIDIESNTRRVLEQATGRALDWTRVGLTEAQAAGIEPIWKVDGRDGRGREAWEVEALGQSAVVMIVRAALASRVPESLDSVHEREFAERTVVSRALGALR